MIPPGANTFIVKQNWRFSIITEPKISAGKKNIKIYHVEYNAFKIDFQISETSLHLETRWES